MSGLASYWNNLSSRERWLIGGAAAGAAVLGSIYLGLLPGLNASRSAESRRAHALSELAQVRLLAGELAAMRAAARDLPEGDAQVIATDIAARHDVTIIQSSAADGGMEASVEAPASANVLNWISGLSASTGLGVTRFSISRGGAGVVATVSLRSAAS